MRTTWWQSGQYNTICDVCGFKMKSTDLRRRWDGLMVCQDDYETQHPQERIRPIPDQVKLPWTRPEGTDTFGSTSLVNGNLVTTNESTIPSGAYCSIITRQSIADTGTADCVTIGWNLFYGAVYPPVSPS